MPNPPPKNSDSIQKGKISFVNEEVRYFLEDLRGALTEAVVTDCAYAWAEVEAGIRRFNRVYCQNYPVLRDLIVDEAVREKEKYEARKKDDQFVKDHFRLAEVIDFPALKCQEDLQPKGKEAEVVFLGYRVQAAWESFQAALTDLKTHSEDEDVWDQFFAAKRDLLQFVDDYPNVVDLSDLKLLIDRNLPAARKLLRALDVENDNPHSVCDAGLRARIMDAVNAGQDAE